jgi:hypothetical protein
MKITKRQIRRIVKEERSKLAEQGLHSMSPAGKALANSIKGKFMRMYPDAKVGIDARGGFITVNGKKAVDMSQATGRGMSDDEMIEKLHAVYAQTQVDADVPTADSRMDTFREGKMKITKRQLKRIIKEEIENNSAVPKIYGMSGPIEFKWSQDGLAMEMHVEGKMVMEMSRQKDVVDLIDTLEALLAGPMRTLP